MGRWTWMLAAGWYCAALPAQAQSDTLYAKRATELRQGPADTSAVVSPLTAQTPVSRLPERQGPWMHVRTAAGQIGWIHMFDVSSVAAPSSLGSAATGALRGLSGLFNRGNTGTTVATSTVGIRGLSSEDIANAQPNLAALQQAEGLRSDASQARRAAGEFQWLARAVEPLPEAPPANAAAEPAANPSPLGRRGGTP